MLLRNLVVVLAGTLACGCAAADVVAPDAGEPTCSDLAASWNALVKSPSAMACSTDADCVFVGGPRTGCDCGPSIAGCGLISSRAAAFSEEARGLEDRFLRECGKVAICDCGTRRGACVLGACVDGPISNCFGSPDGG